MFDDDATAQKYGYKRAKGITPGAKMLMAVGIGIPALTAIICLIRIIAMQH